MSSRGKPLPLPRDGATTSPACGLASETSPPRRQATLSLDWEGTSRRPLPQLPPLLGPGSGIAESKGQPAWTVKPCPSGARSWGDCRYLFAPSGRGLTAFVEQGPAVLKRAT